MKPYNTHNSQKQHLQISLMNIHKISHKHKLTHKSHTHKLQYTQKLSLVLTKLNFNTYTGIFQPQNLPSYFFKKLTSCSSKSLIFSPCGESLTKFIATMTIYKDLIIFF